MAYNNLVKEQSVFKDEIEAFVRNYKKAPKERLSSKNFLIGRLEGIKVPWEKFYKNHLTIMSQMTEIEAKSLDTNLTSVTPGNHVTSKECDVRLPRIELPKFSGSYYTWRSFYELFRTLIHENSTIPKVQKMHYLKTSLEGEAERLIRHLSIIEQNYEPALSIIVSRYDNKRVLVDTNLRMLTTQPSMKTETSEGFKRLIDTTNECLHSLRSLGLQVDSWDSLIIFLLMQKLPSKTQLAWDQSLKSNTELPILKGFIDFLDARFRSLERVYQAVDIPKTPIDSRQFSKSYQRKETRAFYASKGNNCPICAKTHPIRTCPQFLKMNVKTRLEFTSKRQICQNCLAYSHPTQTCNNPKSCYYCKGRHHTLLHNSSNSLSSKYDPELCTPQLETNPDKEYYHKVNTSQQELKALVCDTNRSSFIALLSTAIVKIESANGVHFLRALIDTGSQSSFITERAAQRLRLPRYKITAEVTGLGSVHAETCKSQVTFELRSCYNENFTMEVTALVLKSITGYLPAHHVQNQNTWSHLAGLNLADPTYDNPGHIDLLLGVDVYAQILMSGVRRGPLNSPTAQYTQLGWILFGHVASSPKKIGAIINFHSCTELENLLKQFWELEELPKEKPPTEQESECEKFFEDTYKRTADGRFEVKLPFVKFHSAQLTLGRSRDIAVSQHMHMEKRLSKDPSLYEEYAKCLNEYIKLGHMILSPDSEKDHKISSQDSQNLYTCFYLPHHAVVKESSTTRVRVVFNASQKSSSGQSLNDFLMVGPKLHADLSSIILRWRKHKIAFTADITKMYRQIRVSLPDSQYQRIVWRSQPSEHIKDYNLTTVTFGMACAPYLAIKCLNKLAELEKENYPRAAEIVFNDFYVDDVLSGADDINEALSLQSELISLLSSGGFQLSKWAANNYDLVNQVPEEQREISQILNLDKKESIKTLGLKWFPVNDALGFKVCVNIANSPPSKRTLLAQIAKLFDPLGLLTPVIITAKLYIQKLWLLGLKWDDPVPDSIAHVWKRYESELNKLEELRIPRWINTSPKGRSYQLHGFCDASNKAYAAVIYLRSQDECGNVNISLITSKSKVAPLKPVTLPRLELCGAVLLAKLLAHVQGALKLPNTNIFAWTDSQITLAWIHGEPRRWKPFVCNRVIQIQEKFNCNIWRHVSSSNNPADVGSRGLFPQEILTNHVWWQGPKFLHSPTSPWHLVVSSTDYSTTEEARINYISTHVVTRVDHVLLEIENFSSLRHLLRITALCLRFIKNCQVPKQNREIDWLKTQEIENSLLYWIRHVQSSNFVEEISQLNRMGYLKSSNGLVKLNPYLCENGLLRVGGRLDKANVTHNEKHPILLPSNHQLTTLIIEDAHQSTLHGGPQLVSAFLRKRYWIVNARNIIRKCLHKCTICFRYNAKATSQLMGNLPEPRLVPSRPFSHTGIDYAGPINILCSRGRGRKSYKGYLAIFICLCTKAIHLEAVSDQSTAAFLACFKRFISRRGFCSDVYTDCGTNFVGAKSQLDSDLRHVIKEVSQEAAKAFIFNGIKWHFIPPASPHFGGLWEAGVKSTKYHLKRIVGNSILTFEELSTVLAQIEACLNSRPLSPMSSDPQDLSALTPGHFLIGDSLLSYPEPSLLDINPQLLNRWQYLQQLTQNFWKRWSSEYMTRLQERPKWAIRKPNIQIGNLVLLMDERLNPTRRPLARVIETHPGSDGLVRVVSVKTATNILKRPISRLCLLPIIDNEMNEIER